MECTLGIDLGTGGVRALLLARTGKIVASASSEYPLLTPRPNWAEQDPDEWWHGTLKAVKACLLQATQASDHIDVAAIGLSGQMHGAVFLDGKHNVLRPAILWCDQRTEDQCRQITAMVGSRQLIELTFNRALPGFTAPKILWLRQNEPDIYSKVGRLLLPKDYIRFRLTGSFATEVSDASGTLLFNVRERIWSSEMLAALEIPPAWMPDCYESTFISGHLSTEAGQMLGLPAGTPVVGGGGDQAAGAVGNGITYTGLVSCVLGTSGVVFWHSDQPHHDPQGRLHSFCHAVPGKWHLMGVTLSAGGSLRWFRDTLCQDFKEQAIAQHIDPYMIIDRMANFAPPGCEGLIFLPYLAGERTPYADASARGAFLGLSLRHTRAHMARSVMEGVTMSLKDCIELGFQVGLNTTTVRLSGGGSRSTFWQQLAADILDVDVASMRADEGPAFGATILAAVGAGFYASVEDACESLVRIKDVRKPAPEKVAAYRKLYAIYRDLYGELKGFFGRDAAFAANMER